MKLLNHNLIGCRLRWGEGNDLYLCTGARRVKQGGTCFRLLSLRARKELWTGPTPVFLPVDEPRFLPPPATEVRS